MPYSNEEPHSIFGTPNDDYPVSKPPDLYDFPPPFASGLSATISQSQHHHQNGSTSSFDAGQPSSAWLQPAYPTSLFTRGVEETLPAAQVYDQDMQYICCPPGAPRYHPMLHDASDSDFTNLYEAHDYATPPWASSLGQGFLFPTQDPSSASVQTDPNGLHLDLGPTNYNCLSLVPDIVPALALPNSDNDYSLLPLPPSANFNDASGADQALDPLLDQELLSFPNAEALYYGRDVGEDALPCIELQSPTVSPCGIESPSEPSSGDKSLSEGRVMDDRLLSPNGMSVVHRQVYVHSAYPSPSLTAMSTASDYFSSMSASPSAISGPASPSPSAVSIAGFCNITPQDYVQSPAVSLLDDLSSSASSPYRSSRQRSPSQSSYYSALSPSQRDPNSCPPVIQNPIGPQQHWGPKSSIRGIVTEADFEGTPPTDFETEAHFRQRLRQTFSLDLSDDTPVDLELIPEPALSANGTFPDNSIELMVGVAIWQLMKRGEPARLADIRRAIIERFQWEPKSDKMKSWQSSMRHKLSYSGLFRKYPKDHPASLGAGFPSKHGSTRGNPWFVDIRGAGMRKRETPKSKPKGEVKTKAVEVAVPKMTKAANGKGKGKKVNRKAAQQNEPRGTTGATANSNISSPISPTISMIGPTSTRRMVHATRRQTRVSTPPAASTSTIALPSPLPFAPQPPYPLSMPSVPAQMDWSQQWPDMGQPGPSRYSTGGRTERPAPYPQRSSPCPTSEVEQPGWPFPADFTSFGDGNDPFPG